MVVHSNQPIALRALLVSWMKRYPLTPLENEVVLVQSNGIAQWLKLALAADVDDGGCGIAAALDAQLPSRFLWQAYRAVLGEQAVPLTSPFDKSLLIWRLMRLLPALLSEPVFLPLRRFLQRDSDLRKRYQLAERLADLFDQYQVYRADWLGAWAEGDDTIVTSRKGRQPIAETLRWQPRLWRALLDDVAAEAGARGSDNPGSGTSRAEVHRRFMAAVAERADEPRPAGLPRRLMVFGISSLPQQALEVLSALANWVQVLMCVHNPCEHYWANIIADKDLLRAERIRQHVKPGMPEQIDEGALHLYAHPLLAAWGKQGRDFIGLLDAHDARERYEHQFTAISERIDLFESNGDATLLAQVQDDILSLRPLSETQTQWPAVDVEHDTSIRFHIAHSAQREVEILHDQLLAAFAEDASLYARDVMVMVPDINAYAPHIQAVFGLLDARDPRHIPFRIADQGQRHHDPLLGALEKLLALPQSRLAVSDLLDLLDVPSVRARFDIQASALPLLHRWISAANIRWGLHAEQRRSLDLPATLDQNSWFFGMRRMLLGYAVGSGDAWQGIEPLDEIGGLDAVLLGPLGRFLQRLDEYWRLLREPASPPEWETRLRALMGAFFLAEDGADGFTLMRLDNALQEWSQACSEGGLEEALPLSVVREHWMQQIDQGGLTQPFFAGAVTFATLMPMRAIPFRYVCLLGMNDGDYPRTRVPMDFDLMGQDYRPGDRSRREDDRYLFLEALLSARDHLHISWVGFSIHDNTERPPSVLVAQLRDHLAAGWRLEEAVHPDEGDLDLDFDFDADRDVAADADEEAGYMQEDVSDAAGRASRRDALLPALTIEHRLQPFSRDYFSASGDARLFSFAHEWRTGLVAAGQGEMRPALASSSFTASDLPLTTLADSPLNSPLNSVASTNGIPLPAFVWDADVTLRHLAEFMKDPVRAFFRWRLKVFFDIEDVVSEDQEPFSLNALENWQLQDELIQAQAEAVAQGLDREQVLQAGLARIVRRGELPAANFAAAVRDKLAEPMETLFADYAKALAQWPETIEDEVLRFESRGGESAGSAGVRVADWLIGMRRNLDGERGRVLLESSGLVKKGVYRRDKLIPFWVTHLAAHLGGRPLTTVIVSKVGTVTLPPLPIDQARHYWQALIDAWTEGMTRPLPLAIRTGFVWLEKGGAAIPASASVPDAAAAEAARVSYEMDEPNFARISELSANPYLARAYPSFARLWSDGEFAQLTARLLSPLFEHVGNRAARTGQERGAGN